jgi:hypothetical protein
MAIPNTPATRGGDGHNEVREVATETKSAFKTTELIVYVVSVIAILIAAAVTDKGDDGQGFGAESAWKYVAWLTIGYMISRGLAKSGSYEKERHSDH